MPVQRLKDFLLENDIRYVEMSHSPAYTAQEVAQATHIPGKEVAKTVIVKLDGEVAMAVVPSSYRIDFEELAEETGCHEATLASEDEIGPLFPGCELGAMPPFGNLWGMRVFAADSLAEDERIAFSSGGHRSVISLSFDDFRRLVEPKILHFAKPY